MHYKLIFVITIFQLYNKSINSTNNINHIKNLIYSSLNETIATLTYLENRWHIADFPNFLQSVVMTKTAWEVLKLKYQLKILKSLVLLSNNTNISSNNKVKFVVSFMGSSVTAGHDTPFNQTFPALVQPLLEKSFKAFGIEVITRNAAIGNNPCIPYDLCVRTHAGSDADIIHWEQAYNCHGDDNSRIYVFEQFIRQSNSLHNNPIVVFSDSIVPNWSKESCENISSSSLPKLNDIDKEMLFSFKNNSVNIPTNINRRNIPKIWNSIINLVSSYKYSSIQLWTHRFYESYQCMGPYIDTWGCCSAPWHPSILGHELVAAHYSYFWLLIFKDALETLIDFNNSSDINDIIINRYDQVQRHIDTEHRHLPSAQIYPSNYTDNIQCYTTFEPRNDEKGNLNNLILHNPFDHNPSFDTIIYENIDKPEIIDKARRQGYLDYKYVLYGNMSSSPLSLHIVVNTIGRIYICQPPSDWGQHPKGFRNFWDVNTQVYFTANIPYIEASGGSGVRNNQNNGFIFDSARAIHIDYILRNPEDVLESLCVELLEEFSIGEHVLTITATTHDNIMISYLLVP